MAQDVFTSAMSGRNAGWSESWAEKAAKYATLVANAGPSHVVRWVVRSASHASTAPCRLPSMSVVRFPRTVSGR